MDILFGWAGAGALIVFIALAVRLNRRRSPAALAVLGALVLYPATVAVAWALANGYSFWAISIAYWFAAIVVLMVFGAVYKSVSLRMMLHLLQSPARTTDTGTLIRDYIQDDSFERRLMVAEENGFAERTPSGFVLRAKGRRLAAIVNGVQRAFAIETSG